jgi:hypothetical protein
VTVFVFFIELSYSHDLNQNMRVHEITRVFRKLGSSVIFALSNPSKLDNVDIRDDSVSKKPKKWISLIEWRDEIYKTRSTHIPYIPFVFIFDSL